MPFVESDDPNEITLDVLTASGQVVNALRIRDRDGNVLLALDKDGKMEVLGGIELAGLFLLTGNIGLTGNLTQAGSQAVTGEVSITGDTPATTTLNVKGASGQTESIFKVEKSDGTDFLAVNLDGMPFGRGQEFTESDFLFYCSSYGVYKLMNRLTGEIVATGDQSMLQDAVDYLTDGTGSILDATAAASGSGKGTSAPCVKLNTYQDYVQYDNELVLKDRVHLPPDIILSNFDGGTGVEWTGTCADNTDYVLSGSKSIEVVNVPTSSAITISKTFATPIDLTKTTLTVRFWCSEKLNLNGVELKMANDVGWSRMIDFWTVKPSNYRPDGTGGWYELSGYPPELGVVSGAFDYSQVKYLRVMVWANATGPLTKVVFDHLVGYENRLRRGTVCVTHDEGQFLWEYACPYLDKYGYQVSIGWDSSNDGSWGSPIYPDMIPNLKRMATIKGYDVGTHGFTHVVGDSLRNSIWKHIRDIRFMRHWGIDSDIRVGIWAGGFTNFEHSTEMKKYCHIGRSTTGSYTTGFPNGTMMHLNAPQDPGLTTAKAGVDRAEAQESLYCLLVHTIHPTLGNWTPAQYEEFLDYCATKNVDVVRMSDLVRMYLLGPRVAPYQTLVEHLQDLQAASTTYCHAAEAGTGATKTVSTVLTNPDVPRNVSITTTNVATPAGTVYVNGTNALGETIVEGIVISAGATAYGVKPFASITSYVIPAGVTAADTVALGISDKLGLANPIEIDSDVRKVKVNTADATVGTVDEVRGTVDCATINANDDITIWYRTPTMMG